MKLFLLAVFSIFLDLTTSSPLLSRQATNGPHPPTILWSCLGNTDSLLNIPSACSNMCYGAYCRGYGSTLTWNTASAFPPYWTQLMRKWNAGCYAGIDANGTGLLVFQDDRCQRQGMACSMYPYVTSSDGDVDVQKGGPVSRCVDMGEDARQSAVLNLYTSTGPWSGGQGLNSSLVPSPYHQVFANAGQLPYCSGLASDCTTDGAEFDRQGTIFTYDPLPQQQKQRKYRLSGGANVTVMHGMDVGRKGLVPRVRDEKAFLEVSERRGVEREMMMEMLGEFLYFDIEEIQEEILGIFA